MLNLDNNKFSYDSDVSWLIERSRFYYYAIILILICLKFYLFALLYAIFATTLIWEVDELDRIDYEMDIRGRKSKHSVINLNIMIDYLESVLPIPELSVNLNEVNEFFSQLDESLNNRYFIFTDFDNNIKSIKYIKKGLVKLDDKTDEASLFREKNYELIKSELMNFKSKILSTSDIKKRNLIKKRIKKLLELSKELEDNLFRFKISVQSHNTVLIYNHLKSGLYPFTDFDLELNLYSDFYLIEYSEYLYFYGFIDNQKDNNYYFNVNSLYFNY